MIPVLYERDETEFVTNGLGALAEAITCVVTEERNGSFELKMTYPASGVMFHEIVNDRIILAKPAQGRETEPFRIYMISKPINGIITINAEHISYQLSYVPVSPFSVKSVTVDKVFEQLIAHQEETHPFTFWTDNDRSSNFTLPNPMVMRETLGGWEGSIVDMFRGEYEFNRYTVKLWKNRGSNKGFEIRYGKNLTDLKQDENIGNVVTSIYPFYYYDDGETQTLVTLPEKILDSEYADRYQFRRTVCHDFTERFQQTPTVEELRKVAEQYLGYDYIGIPSVNITVKFAQLEQSGEFETLAMLEEVGLCDTVNVIFEQLDIRTTAKVTKAVYDVLMDRFDSLTFGDVRTGLVKTFTETNKAFSTMIKNIVNYFPKVIGSQTESFKELLEKTIKENTELITGALGGNVVWHFDEETGLPTETLWLDTDEELTAKNVIRINHNGIGLSTNGVNGPFRYAMTGEGFNADVITAGTINAALVKIANLVVGDNVTMGPNAKLSWGNITDQPSIPSEQRITEISQHQISIANLDADHINTGTLNGIKVIAIEGNIGGWVINNTELSKESAYDYTWVNSWHMAVIVSAINGSMSQEEAIAAGCDFNGDGIVDFADLAIVFDFLLNASAKSGNSKRIVRSDNPLAVYEVIDGSGKAAFSAGVTGAYAKSLICQGITIVNERGQYKVIGYDSEFLTPSYYSDYNSSGAHDGAIPELSLTASDGLGAYLNKLLGLKTGTKVSVWLNGSSAIGQEVRGSLNPLLGGDNYGQLVMEKVREGFIFLSFRNYDNAHCAQATWSNVNDVRLSAWKRVY